MRKIDWEKERERLDREITFFHFKKAERIIKKALKKAREEKIWFYVYYFTAQECILKEKFKEAIKYLNKALKIRPYDALSYNDKAICLAELGEFKKAEMVFDEALQKNKDNPILYHNKGWLLNFIGKDREAIVYFHKALEFDPQKVESIFSLADSYFKLGKYKEAKKFFEKAKRLLRGRSKYLYREAKRRLKEVDFYLSKSGE